MIQHTTPISGVVQLHPGVLKLSGKDAADFLNRMSTNDLSKLKKGDCVTTVLTTEKGRMIDVVRVIALDGLLLVLTGEGSEGAVRHWLERYVIMEDIQFSSESAGFFVLNLFGEAISPALSFAGLGGTFPAERNAILAITPEGETIAAFQDELWPPGVMTLFASGGASRLASLLSEINGATSTITTGMLEACMVSQGVPAPGTEITGEYNPLECNFWRFVSFSKGCYIGQEVIARLDSYQKLQKRMTGFHFDPGIIPGPAPGKIYSGSDEVGKTTRHAVSLGGERWNAVGFLKISADPLNLSFESTLSSGRERIHAVTLPFTMS